MTVYIDIIRHIIISLFVGYGSWRLYALKDKKTLKMSFISALISGVLIDIDHFVDYFLTFGLNFNLDYFINGMEFFESGKNYVLFHGFEYSFFLLILSLIVKSRVKKMLLTTLALSLLMHLFTDVVAYSIPIKSYFLLYRLLNGFNAPLLMPT